MYTVTDAERNDLKKFKTLIAAKKWAIENFPNGPLYFDGDPDLGAKEISIYDNDDEEPVGFIEIGE